MRVAAVLSFFDPSFRVKSLGASAQVTIVSISLFQRDLIGSGSDALKVTAKYCHF